MLADEAVGTGEQEFHVSIIPLQCAIACQRSFRLRIVAMPVQESFTLEMLVDVGGCHKAASMDITFLR
jgi:hypothetical protein